jgi:hypothetical protein
MTGLLAHAAGALFASVEFCSLDGRECMLLCAFHAMNSVVGAARGPA